MITQRVVWTLLPNGISDDTKRARASVLVSPRLILPNTTTPTDLSHFPYWHDWPRIVRDASFKVAINGGAAIDAALTSKPDSEIWKAIFPKTTFVEPWQFDAAGMINKVILSYPVAAVAALVETLYGQIGMSAQTGLPKRRDLKMVVNGSDAVAGIANVAGIRPRPKSPAEVIDILRRQQKSQADRGKATANPKAGASQGIMGDPSHALDLLQAYHTPLEAEKTGTYAPNQKPDNYDTKFPGMPNPFRHGKWKTRERSPLPAAQDFKTFVDFHRIAAALCQYPDLTRLCGLVLDLEFERPNNLAAPATFELKVDWLNLAQPGPAATEPDVIPKIVANLSKSTFHAAKRNNASPIVERYLKLSNDDFSLVQMDVDGAGMKLKNLRESLTRELPVEYDDESFEEPATPDAGLPSLRTSGLMLAEKRRDLSLTALLQRADSMQASLTSSSQPPTLYAEDIIRGYRVDIRDDVSQEWRSLFFRKVDFALTNTGGAHSTPKEEGMARIAAAGSTDNTNTDVVKIHEGLVNWSGWSLAAPEPGKLLKGDDSVGADDGETPPGLPLKTKYAATPGSLPRLRFGRTYAMRMRLVDLAGASEEFSASSNHPKGAESQPATFRRHEPVEPPALALVSANGTIDPLGEGESMQQVAIRTWNDTPAKNNVATNQTARRHIVPTRVGHRFAELHGVMDTGAGGALDKSIYAMLVARDKPLPEAPINRSKTSTPQAPERYAFADENFKLPYLPDPLAVGAAIKVVGAEGVDPNLIHKVRLYCSANSADCKWPNARPFKIVVAESGLADAKFDDTTREFRIPLRKAERARVYISCLIPKNATAMMAVYQMILQRNPDANSLKAIQKLIEDGQHWMFTPWRVIEIVHAVQKPLITPVMTNLSIGRELGDTAAKPGIESLPLHSKSTARVDMDGEWREPVDDPSDLQAAEGPYALEQKAHAFSKKIARNDAINGKYNYFTGRHVFANTHYRRVKYTLDATTRYKEFFDEPLRANEANLKVTSPPRIGWVPNSAPPPPPSVLYVVPTFGWVRTNKDNQQSSLRAGGGLRVYLDRPWMTTGFTEMLGVVLPHISDAHPVSNALADSRYAGSVTMWGSDPIWANPAKIQNAAPPLNAFPLARTAPPIAFEGSGLPAEEGTDLPPGAFFHTGLPHPETKDPKDPIRLDVAPHIVGYDPDRRLWYCDIVIRPSAGTYYPFVRLALARFNPISAYRAHLSAMVLTEFQQLTPDRLVIVSKNAAGNQAHVAVYGVAGKSPIENIEPDRFEAVAQVLADGADPDLDWRTVEPPKLKRAQLPVRTARADISQLSTARSAQTQEAEILLQNQGLDKLIARPDLLFQLRPPLLWEDDVTLPAAGAGERRRILVTEKEYYEIEHDDLGAKPDSSSATQISGRIVYIETLDV